MTAWPLTPAEAALVADPHGVADAMTADAARASMAPLDLLPSEAADYAEAVEVAADFLTTTYTPTLYVSKSPTEVGTGTVAALLLEHGGATGEAFAILSAAARVATWCTSGEKVGASWLFHHRRAMLTQSADADDLTAARLFVVEVPKGTGLAKMLTEDGAKPFALVALYPDRTYRKTDRKTGELVEAVDLGNYNPERVWPGRGGIVRMMTRDQADGLLTDWAWDPDTRNVAWALSTLRRLAAIAAARSERKERLAAEHADEMPF